MNLNWLDSLIYGLVSGFAEFLPISSNGHQQLLIHLFGAQEKDPIRDLLIHLMLLFVIYTNCRRTIEIIRHEQQRQYNRRATTRNASVLLDYKFVKYAATPMIAVILVLSFVLKSEQNLLLTSAFLLINGIILFVSGRVMQGNKDARSMSKFDSLLVGILSGLSVIPGLSLVGCSTSVAVIRGSDRQHAFNWTLLLCIPALIVLSGLDVINIFTVAGSISFWRSFFTYILSAIGAYIGGFYAISLMRFLAVRTGFSVFSYYCWGASLFTFLVYLTVA